MMAGVVSAAFVGITACVPPPPAGPPVVIGPPPAPPASVQSSWDMNEPSGTVMKDSLIPRRNGAIGPAVGLRSGYYDFPGWVNNVDGAGNFFGTMAPSDSQVAVADAAHELEPKNAAFSVDARILMRRTGAGTLPVGVVGTGYNLIQKARASNLGGFWKVEIRGHGNGLGHLVCTLGDGRVVVSVESEARVDDGGWHDVACRLNGNVFSAVVDGVGANVDASSLGAVNPVERFSTEMLVGKKPGSTDPSDSYSGFIDNLRVSAG